MLIHRKRGTDIRKFTTPMYSERTLIEWNRKGTTLPGLHSHSIFVSDLQGSWREAIYVQLVFEALCVFPGQWFVLIRSNERRVLGVILFRWSSIGNNRRNGENSNSFSHSQKWQIALCCCIHSLQTQWRHGGVALTPFLLVGIKQKLFKTVWTIHFRPLNG